MISYKNIKGFSIIEDIKEKYALKQQLGEGAFGEVKMAIHRKAKIRVAIKIIKKSTMQKSKDHEKLMR